MTSRISSSTDKTDMLPQTPSEMQDQYTVHDPVIPGKGEKRSLSDASDISHTSATETTSGTPFLSRQRGLLGRRLWPAALTFLAFFLYNIAGAATILISTAQEAFSQNLAGAQKTAALHEAVRFLFGFNSPCAFMIVFPLAAILAIEGFSWMNSRQQVDFYESLPVPRRQRFLDICISGFLYFIFSYLITLEAGLLIAGAMGALSRGLLVEIIQQALRTTAFFTAIYGLGVLSAMLTGNVVVAGCAFLVLLLYETEFKMALRGYCSVFFSTWSKRPSGFLTSHLSDPFSHYNYMVGGPGGPLRLIALAAVYFLLAWIAYRLRKNECAGTAVVFGPVRSVVRVAVSLITGLVAGLVFSSLQESRSLAVVWLILFTVITACIMQIIYDYDFKALFRRPAEIAVAAVLGLIIYFGFFFDIAGYDRFIPDPGKVADAALVFSDTYSYDSIYNERGENVDLDTFGEEYMHLEKVEDVIAIAQFGQEYTRKSDAMHGREGTIHIDSPLVNSSGPSSGSSPENISGSPAADASDAASGNTSGDNSDRNASDAASANSSGSSSGGTIENNTPTYNCTVVYRMKNGENIVRTFRLPCSVDPAAMNAVVGTKAWREGSFSIYHDEAIRSVADIFTIDYTNAKDYSYGSMDSKKYKAFREAYIRDLEQFTYSFAAANRPVGRLTLNYDSRLADAALARPEGTSAAIPDKGLVANLEGATIGFPVYSTFTNTIAFLKDNGLWIDSLDYKALPLRDTGNLTREEQDLIDSIDFSILSGPFCLPED